MILVYTTPLIIIGAVSIALIGILLCWALMACDERDGYRSDLQEAYANLNKAKLELRRAYKEQDGLRDELTAQGREVLRLKALMLERVPVRRVVGITASKLAHDRANKQAKGAKK